MVPLRDDWSAAILAGGYGRRLGSADKSAQLVGGRSILDRQLDTLAACGLSPTVITRAGHTPTRPVRTLTDRLPDHGPLGGLFTALADARAPRLLLLAGDLPFVSPAFLQFLMACATSETCVVPSVGGHLQPLCAAYPTSIVDHVESQLCAGRLAVRSLFDRVACRVLSDDDRLPFDPDGMLLFNINTSDDLLRARRYADSRLGAHRTAGSGDRQTFSSDLPV